MSLDPAHSNGSALLTVRGLCVDYVGARGSPRPALRELDLDLRAGRTFALVGESGSGKSSAALALSGLLPRSARLRARELSLSGRDLRALDERGWDGLRGAELGVVFQDPSTALDPVMRAGAQVAEGPLAHGVAAPEARRRALAWLGALGFAEPGAVWERFPHELSGGERQRVGLAMALVAEPRVLIADEPTTALDVTLRARALALLARRVRGTGSTTLLVTHDWGSVASLADEVGVLHAGRLVERAEVRALFAAPRHPYTLELLRARPERRGRRPASVGGGPRPVAAPTPEVGAGCAFAPRCPLARARCEQAPPWTDLGAGAGVACWFSAEVERP